MPFNLGLSGIRDGKEKWITSKARRQTKNLQSSIWTGKIAFYAVTETVSALSALTDAVKIAEKYDDSIQSQSAFEEDVPEEQEEIRPAEETLDDDDWENRRLCSDGNCIGIIGPDGRCKQCGKPLEG